jgi:hypothetical protein
MKYLLTLFIGLAIICCFLSGQDESKIDMAEEIKSASKTEWVSLFNGKDLAGWVDVNTKRRRGKWWMASCTAQEYRSG